MFSMANDASGLIDTHHHIPRLLTADNNNARCAIVSINDTLHCMLYAVQYIPSYTDIMWTYNRSPIESRSRFPSAGLRSAYNAVLDLETRLADISVTDESAQLTALGSYHEHNDTDT